MGWSKESKMNITGYLKFEVEIILKKLSFKEKVDILPAVRKYKYDDRDLHEELVGRKVAAL